jgi:hypothetical protein
MRAITTTQAAEVQMVVIIHQEAMKEVLLQTIILPHILLKEAALHPEVLITQEVVPLAVHQVHRATQREVHHTAALLQVLNQEEAAVLAEALTITGVMQRVVLQ